jgi:CBS domain-containing protein
MSTNIPSSLNLGRSTVRGAMQLGLFECAPETNLRTLAGIMGEKTIHSIVVAGPRWGIVSDLDLMRGLASGLIDVTAGELAATDFVTVDPNDTLDHAAQLMAEHETAHLVVVSPATGMPVGMLSTLDVARAVNRARLRSE